MTKNWYLRERPPEGLCLAFVKLRIQAADSEEGRLAISTAEIRGKLMAVDKKGRFLLDSLRVTEEKQGLQLTFWCQSGTKCFKPTTKPLKNCVEVVIFEFTKLALETTKGKITKTDIHYVTDLSPCPVCTKRLPTQKSTMDSYFPNITFTYNEQHIFDYDITYKDQLQEKETWMARGTRGGLLPYMV